MAVADNGEFRNETRSVFLLARIPGVGDEDLPVGTTAFFNGKLPAS